MSEGFVVCLPFEDATFSIMVAKGRTTNKAEEMKYLLFSTPDVFLISVALNMLPPLCDHRYDVA